ncbi:hypothetical protein CDD83_10689 [Cordyceps sp. RAO-2017]|nr:hypothetical protein CDD83_10689 [Cordyceps sp. RAO-2017]
MSRLTTQQQAASPLRTCPWEEALPVGAREALPASARTGAVRASQETPLETPSGKDAGHNAPPCTIASPGRTAGEALSLPPSPRPASLPLSQRQQGKPSREASRQKLALNPAPTSPEKQRTDETRRATAERRQQRGPRGINKQNDAASTLTFSLFPLAPRPGRSPPCRLARNRQPAPAPRPLAPHRRPPRATPSAVVGRPSDGRRDGLPCLAGLRRPVSARAREVPDTCGRSSLLHPRLGQCRTFPAHHVGFVEDTLRLPLYPDYGFTFAQPTDGGLLCSSGTPSSHPPLEPSIKCPAKLLDARSLSLSQTPRRAIIPRTSASHAQRAPIHLLRAQLTSSRNPHVDPNRYHGDGYRSACRHQVELKSQDMCISLIILLIPSSAREAVS